MKLNSYEKWKNSVTSLADDFVESGKVGKARDLLEKVLLVNPGQADVRMRILKAMMLMNKPSDVRAEGMFLALLNAKQNQTAGAFEILSKLLEQFPQDLNLHLKAAQLAVELGEIAKAEAIYLSVANIFLEKNLSQKGIEIYKRLIEINPENFQYYRKLAEIFVREKILDKGIRQYLELADRYQGKGLLEEAAATYEQILSIDPNNEEASLPLAKLYVKQAKTSQGVQVMRKQADNWLNKGRVEEAFGLAKRFIDFLVESSQYAEANQEREQIAEALFTRGRQDQAVALFIQAAEGALSLQEHEKYLELMGRVVKFYQEQGNFAKLVDHYQKMILTTVSYDQARVGKLLEEFTSLFSKPDKLPILDQAMRHMAKEMEEQGDLQQVNMFLLCLAEVYAQAYKYRDAIRILEAMLLKGTREIKTYLRLAELYVQEENLPRALDLYISAAEICAANREGEALEEIFNLAVKKDSKNPSLFSRMGYIYYGMGEWDKALAQYSKALELDPYYRHAVVGTAMTYARKGMLEEMVGLAKRLVTKGLIAEIIEEYRKALMVTSTPPQASMALGRLYKDLGFMEEAIIEFQKASKDSKCLLEAYNELGLCFKDQGFVDLAIRQFRKALENKDYSDEETLGLRYNLALAYEEAKIYQEAYDLYNDILVVDIGYKDVRERLHKLATTQPSGKVVSFPSDSERGGRKNT